MESLKMLTDFVIAILTVGFFVLIGIRFECSYCFFLSSLYHPKFCFKIAHTTLRLIILAWFLLWKFILSQINLVRELAGLPKLSKPSSQQSKQRKRQSIHSYPDSPVYQHDSRRNSSYSQNSRRESFASQRSQRYKPRRSSSTSSRSSRDQARMPTSPASPTSPTLLSNRSSLSSSNVSVINDHYFSESVPMHRKFSSSSASTTLNEDNESCNRSFSSKSQKEGNILLFKEDYI
ncbi:11847_t:CDS:1 [Acaulospora morrowiae]|uniref:11847_t:CDS:1 n=1 Tax=Acaulospora morrowiae TaxID=94023 RepID=A0A9N9HWE5_9GLOM|nr:11847_t:CDS:1 [Acaulospora morrowiae]